MPYSWGEDDSKKWAGGGFSYGDEKKTYSSESLQHSESDMDQAYRVAARLVRGALSTREHELLRKLTGESIVIVPGTYDAVEKILESAELPFTLTQSEGSISLAPEQVLLVNCPGNNVEGVKYRRSHGLTSIATFVKDGGFLISTDWVLDSVIPCFPQLISHGGKNTDHDVVEIDLVAENSPYTRRLGNGSLKPLWWLESSSYPVEVNQPGKVDILLGSKEMQEKYGKMPIAVKFAHGEGRVIHVVSHFYLKYFKAKYKEQEKKTAVEFVKLFLNMSPQAIQEIKGLNQIGFGAIEAAYTSVCFLYNILLEKLKRNAAMRQDGHTSRMESST
jgi:hypothetical protein